MKPRRTSNSIRILRKLAEDTAGQASVEYAVVLSGVLAFLIALGVFHTFLEDGALVSHALHSASHAIQNVCIDSIKDVMCF